jgi:sterol desaturase/sphingolipid hydroxylase (fatty acid hydroxylase superfamily)
MQFLNVIYDGFLRFFGIEDLLKIIHSGNYNALLTRDGIISIFRPLFPLLLIIEIIKCVIQRKFRIIEYKIPFFSYLLNNFIGAFLSFAVVIFCIGFFERFAVFKTSFTWWWFIYGYIIWELSHFVYHYLGHKIRLFWCLHSTHHAPEKMNLSLAYAHFFLEAPYADFIRTTICILLGVNPPMLLIIMFIDGLWGGFIHVGEHLIKDGRFGFLNKIILTPSHHRVHHARNPLYMDTNFCNLLPIWDKLFKTYQPEDKMVLLEYGITRKMKPNSFLDSYFGEFSGLMRDVVRAPGLKNKLLYIFMPPGWSHTGDHKTASKIRRDFIIQQNAKSLKTVNQ